MLKSAAGYYIGTRDEEGQPYTRESQEYYQDRDQAEYILATGSWTQREHL